MYFAACDWKCVTEQTANSVNSVSFEYPGFQKPLRRFYAEDLSCYVSEWPPEFLFKTCLLRLMFLDNFDAFTTRR